MNLNLRHSLIMAGLVLVCLLPLPSIVGCGGSDGGISVMSTQNPQDPGVRYETAIKVGSIGEQLDIMNGTSCGEGGFYRKTHVEIIELNGRHYDIVDAACTSGDSSRKFYFDVSSCFPCPD